MPQMDIQLDALPSGAHVYQFAMVDTPGVVAANNFLSHFNPAASGKTAAPLGLVIQPYAINNSSTPNSMTLFRTSAASVGTLISAATITRWNPGIDPNPVTEIRTGNPTVTTTGLALIGIAPIVSSGASSNSAALVAPFTIPPTLPNSTGLVFTTAAGNVNQLWNIQYTWMEF
jgi:hypothetical protein